MGPALRTSGIQATLPTTRPASSLRALLKGAVLGAVTPFCGCSTIPLLLGLLRARVHLVVVALVGLGASWERSGLGRYLKLGVRPSAVVPAAVGSSACPSRRCSAGC